MIWSRGMFLRNLVNVELDIMLWGGNNLFRVIVLVFWIFIILFRFKDGLYRDYFLGGVYFMELGFIVIG